MYFVPQPQTAYGRGPYHVLLQKRWAVFPRIMQSEKQHQGCHRSNAEYKLIFTGGISSRLFDWLHYPVT